MRSTAREAVYKYLFSKLFNEESDNKFFDGLLNAMSVKGEDRVFAERLKTAVEEHYAELSEKIDVLSEGYKFARIFSTDKCALIIGMAEIEYFDDVPDGVAADEAVKLAAKYSTERSLSFVNGILAAYIKEKNNNG